MFQLTGAPVLSDAGAFCSSIIVLNAKDNFFCCATIACGEEHTHWTILTGKLKERDYFIDVNVDGRTILLWIWREMHRIDITNSVLVKRRTLQNRLTKIRFSKQEKIPGTSMWYLSKKTQHREVTPLTASATEVEVEVKTRCREMWELARRARFFSQWMQGFSCNSVQSCCMRCGFLTKLSGNDCTLCCNIQWIDVTLYIFCYSVHCCFFKFFSLSFHAALLSRI